MSIYKTIADEFYDEAVETIMKIVNINSVYDENTVSKDMPYGAGVNKALYAFRDIAREHGLNAEVVGNRCVEINVGEEGREVGIFAHLDVVPATGDWVTPPFEANIREDRIYGRGTSDDKGPLVCSLMAVLGLIKHGLVNNYRIRIVAGGDEERGSSCLDYYFNTLKKPVVDCGFTPDAEFPLIYGEKGIVNYTMNKEIILPGVRSIEAGIVPNSVIDKAKVDIIDKDDFVQFLQTTSYKFHLEDNFVVFDGLSAHGSTPELGFNAGTAMLLALSEYLKDEKLAKFAKLHQDYNGRNMGLCQETKNMGITTFNVGVITYKDGLLKVTVNFRYPESVNVHNTLEKVKELADCEIEVGQDSPVLYFDPESDMIKTLYKAYKEESGDEVHKPMTIGGGTYAKEAKNIVAFGSNFPGKIDHIHEPNEKIDLEDIRNSIQLYARAIYDLGNM